MKTKDPMPPTLFLKLFRWYCNPRLRDYIEGDLMEVYGERVKQKGQRKADLQFCIDVLLLLRPAIIKPIAGYQNLNTFGMYKSYFKVGWRNLARNKGYSFINIGGLAIGMAVAMLNGLWIWDEVSYNKYFDNYSRIAHVAEQGLDYERGGHWVGTTVTYPLATELKDQYAQHFKRISRTSWDVDAIFSAGEQKVSANGIYVDKDFPAMFSLKMISGSRDGLSHPNSLLISSSMAKAFWGNEDPLNRILSINNQTDVKVTGVYEDLPANTRFNGYNFFGSWDRFLADNKWIEKRAQTDLRNHFLKIYVEIPEGSSFPNVNAEVKSALKYDPQDEERAAKQQRELYLYPMSEWHLHPSEVRNAEYDPLVMVKLVGLIGVFVLLLACINFMNLTTARSDQRAKEVGIRKTIGSARSQLVHQFFSESILVVFFAFIFALLLTSSFLPAFNDIADKKIKMPWTNGTFWLACMTFVLFTGILAGSYPAMYLSSFNPIKTLKRTFRIGQFAAIPRKVLVVFQFSISVVLIIGTSIVYQQIQFAKNRPVGYDREGLIMMSKKSGDFYGKYEVLRNELKNTGVVLEVSESMGAVTQVASGNNGWSWEGHNPAADESFATLAVSHMHGKTAGWQFIAGRDFDISLPNDSSGIIINESALKVMGLANPIGESVTWTWWVDKRMMDYKIIGVVKDMVMASPYAPVEPTIFYLKGFNGTPNIINIKISPKVSLSDALPQIERVFKRVIPTAPFEYKFVDDEYARKFAKEERVGRLAAIFAVLAIIISSLGLLGLASFVAEQRTKEIGIRKVLGASVLNLWKMLSKDFMVLVLISCVIASPLAYYFLSGWLEKFSYRTDISLWIFVVTGIGVILLTVFTVSYQAIKAALMNPVKSLKSE